MNKKNNNKETVQTESAKGALVFLESRGKTASIGALDIMPKTSEVSFVRRVNIGSGLVTVVYSGEVAAARSAGQAASEQSGKIGEVIFSNVIPRPHERIYSLVSQRSGEESGDGSAENNRSAVGIIETDGFVPMIEAADQGIKAANVTIPGWVTVGSGLTTVFFRGEVAACQSAVEAGSIAADKLGKVISCHIIAQPHVGTEETTPIGNFAGTSVLPKVSWDDALGILETKGITTLIEGIDAGLKAASVSVQGWEKIGRGITSTLFRGTVADVRSAMDAALKSANDVGEVVGSHVIARPHRELDKGK